MISDEGLLEEIRLRCSDPDILKIDALTLELVSRYEKLLSDFAEVSQLRADAENVEALRVELALAWGERLMEKDSLPSMARFWTAAVALLPDNGDKIIGEQLSQVGLR